MVQTLWIDLIRDSIRRSRWQTHFYKCLVSPVLLINHDCVQKGGMKTLIWNAYLIKYIK